MPLEQRLHLKQTMQLRMTPQLRQAIKILQVSRSELETIVADELYQNPTLEETDGGVEEPGEAASRTGDVEQNETEAPAVKVSETDSEASDLRGVDWEEYLDRYGSNFHGSIGTGSDRDDNRTSFLENTAEKHDDLLSALTDQLHLVPMNEQEQNIGSGIVP